MIRVPYSPRLKLRNIGHVDSTFMSGGGKSGANMTVPWVFEANPERGGPTTIVSAFGYFVSDEMLYLTKRAVGPELIGEFRTWSFVAIPPPAYS